MRRLVALIAVVGFGLVFLHIDTAFSHEGHSHGSRKAEVEEQQDVDETPLNPDEAPEIVFEKTEHEFGEVYAGEKAEHLFKFENRGKGDLIIKKVKTSCGCTAAATSTQKIAPGGFGEIKTTFKAGQHPMSVRKVITVTTNDPAKPRVQLAIIADIIVEIVTRPQWISFGNITREEIGTQSVVIRPGTDFDLEVTRVVSDSQYVTTAYRKHEDGEGYIVDATTTTDAPLGMLKGNIIVTNNSKRQPILTIPFSGKITGDVLVSRSVVSYGVVPQGRESVRKLIVTLRKKDVDIKDVEITPEFLSADIQAKSNPDLPYREVLVRLKDDAPVGKIFGSIKIHTSSKFQPVIEIPVLGEIRGRETEEG